MRKITYYLLLLLLISNACDNKVDDKSIEIIPVDMSKLSDDYSNFIDRIEIIPLETTNESVFKSARKVIYNKEMNMYGVLDDRFIAYLFSGDGHFIASSEKAQGDGPQQYQIIVDMMFNPYQKGIDLLSPYGTIYTYDKHFKLIAKTETTTSREIYSEFIPYGKGLYLFAPGVYDNSGKIIFADVKQKKAKAVNYNTTFSNFNIKTDCFYRINNQFYYVPNMLDYYFYRIDTKTQTMMPFMKIDMGKETINELSLPGIAMVGSNDKNSDKVRTSNEMQKRTNYLLSSNYYLPASKFFNEKYVYVNFLKNKKLYNFIYNRQTKQTFVQAEGKPIKLFHCFAFQENELLSCVPISGIDKCIDERLLSPKAKEVISKLKEDDNDVIMKLILK